MWEMLFPLIGNVLDKVLPNKEASDAAKLRLAELAQQGELAELSSATDLAKAQIGVNQAEAQSDGWFKGGWRPAIGYVLCFSLAFQYVISPLFVWVCSIWYPAVKPPVITMDEHMWQLILGILGLSINRSWEKRSLATIKAS